MTTTRSPAQLRNEPGGVAGASRHSQTRRGRWLKRGWRRGGTEGNEILTSAAAVVLVVLLVAEGITIVQMQGLLSAHMFIGLVLIPPVMIKLGSTGYRMVSYYAGARAYRVKGAPLLPLRLMAPAWHSDPLSMATATNANQLNR